MAQHYAWPSSLHRLPSKSDRKELGDQGGVHLGGQLWTSSSEGRSGGSARWARSPEGSRPTLARDRPPGQTELQDPEQAGLGSAPAACGPSRSASLADPLARLHHINQCPWHLLFLLSSGFVGPKPTKSWAPGSVGLGMLTPKRTSLELPRPTYPELTSPRPTARPHDHPTARPPERSTDRRAHVGPISRRLRVLLLADDPVFVPVVRLGLGSQSVAAELVLGRALSAGHPRRRLERPGIAGEMREIAPTMADVPRHT